MRLRFYIVILYVICLTLCLYTTVVQGISDGDMSSEIPWTMKVIKEGWHPFDYSIQNNTSMVVGGIVPAITSITKVHPADVYKLILPIFYSFTPVLLFLFYRRFFNINIAFLAALFFIFVLPTFQEVPTNGKSMVGQVLLAGTLYLSTSDMGRVKLAVTTTLLTVGTALAHYTVGLFLLGFLIILLVFSRNRYVLLIPIILGGAFFWGYFSQAGNGIVIWSITNTGSFPGRSDDDMVMKAIIGQDFFEPLTSENELVFKQLSPREKEEAIKAAITGQDIGIKDINWVGRLARIYVLMAEAIIFIGLFYLAWNWRESWLNRHITGLMFACSAMVLLAMLIPFFTKTLFFSRWVQLLGYGYSPLFIMGLQVIRQINQVDIWHRTYKVKLEKVVS